MERFTLNKKKKLIVSLNKLNTLCYNAYMEAYGDGSILNNLKINSKKANECWIVSNIKEDNDLGTKLQIYDPKLDSFEYELTMKELRQKLTYAYSEGYYDALIQYELEASHNEIFKKWNQSEAKKMKICIDITKLVA